MSLSSAPSLAPTLGLNGYSTDDDELVLIESVSNERWIDVARVSLTMILFSACCIVFFEIARRTSKTAHALVFYPRARWERAATSNKRDLARPRRKELPFVLDWLRSTRLFGGDDGRALRHVGLEMHMFLRFVRLARELCVVGSLTCVLVLAPVYATASGDQAYSRWEFHRFTLANVDAEANVDRMWAPAVLIFVVTAHCLYACARELAYFSSVRLDSWTEGPSSGAAEGLWPNNQALRSALVEGVPPSLATPAALKAHFDDLLGPDKVHSASVPVVAQRLDALHADREDLALRLERLLIRRRRTGREPTLSDATACCGLDAPSILQTGEKDHLGDGPIIPVLEAHLARLNDECRVQRALLEFSQPGTIGGSRRYYGADDDDDDDDDAAPEVRKMPATDDVVKKGSSAAALAAAAKEKTEAAGVEAAVYSPFWSSSSEKETGAAGGPKTSTGFVTCYDLATANQLRQMPLELGMVAYARVPDYYDVIWPNVCESKGRLSIRASISAVVVCGLAIYWTGFISLVYSLTALQPPKKVVRGINPDLVYLLRYVYTMGPVTVLALSLALLPHGLQILSTRFERLKLSSDVELTVLRRNFMYQMINLWWSVVAGSVFDIFTELVENPQRFFALFGTAVPLVSVYFASLLVLKTGFLLWELARPWPYLRYRVACAAAGGALSKRDCDTRVFLKPHFQFSSEYVSVAMVAIIALLFAVLAPLVYLFALAYTALALPVYTHQALHVYIPQAESAGLFFVPMLNRLLFALIFVQVTVTGFLLVKFAYVPAGLVATLPLATSVLIARASRAVETGQDRAALSATSTADKQTPTPQLDPAYYYQPALKNNDAVPHTDAVLDDDDDITADDSSHAAAASRQQQQQQPPPSERTSLLSDVGC